MPTGYTAMIEEDGNTNAREYIKTVARAFGMFAHQREDSFDAELRYPSEDGHYRVALDQAEKALQEVRAWTPEKIAQKHREYVTGVLESNQRSVSRAEKINAAYETVLAKLYKWNPTDEINQNVKKFALDQINICYPAHSYTVAPEINQKVWYEGHIVYLEEDVAYYAEQVENEANRLAEHRKAIDNFLADLENIPE